MDETTSHSKFSIQLKGEEQENQDGQQSESTSPAEARTSPFQCGVQTPYCA
jgi:hypothetical protein